MPKITVTLSDGTDCVYEKAATCKELWENGAWPDFLVIEHEGGLSAIRTSFIVGFSIEAQRVFELEKPCFNADRIKAAIDKSLGSDIGCGCQMKPPAGISPLTIDMVFGKSLGSTKATKKPIKKAATKTAKRTPKPRAAK